MTRFLLIRHGSTDMLDIGISGRAPGISLNVQGQREVERLVERLATRSIAALYVSPLERTRETAAALERRFGLRAVEEPAFLELDFGEWTGQDFGSLHADPRWRDFNLFRCGTRIPDGELMLETQARSVSRLLELRDRHRGTTVAIVSHGDVIKVALLYFLGMPLDHHVRLDVAPASCSELELGRDWVRVLSISG
ncbi:MAG TPA: histidine phosphatase family protein [Polyangiales bacterium]|nr:histidine phosphatase family protein [Polyangiales bacterium]